MVNSVLVAEIISVLIFCVIAYLLGSINFAIIFTKIFSHTDVREHGSGNAGMTNVMRTSGKLPGILTFLGDFLKGTVAVLLGKYLFEKLAMVICPVTSGTDIIERYINPDIVAYVVAIFCLVGHMFPIFFGFKGGKGVATIVGCAAAFQPMTALICFVLFLILTFTTKIVSISSIVAVTAAIPCVYIFFDKTNDYIMFGSHQALVATILMAIMSSMVILKHKSNIKRLINGTENKIGSKKKG